MRHLRCLTVPYILRNLRTRVVARAQLSTSRFPPRRQQSPPSVACHRDSRLVQFLSIPKLASDLSMRLIESFAIVCVRAASNSIASAEFHFSKPIRIGERLPRHANDVGLPAF